MKIISATDTIEVKHPITVIFGPPGVCKTSLAYSARKVLLLDTDRGAHRAANRGDTLQVDRYDDIVELLNTAGALDDYSAIAIDTIGRLLDKATVYLIAKDPKNARGSGDLSIQGWGALKKLFKGLMVDLEQRGLDVVLIAHDSEEKLGDNIVNRPDIQGGSYEEVMKVGDLVGYLSIQGKNRILDFNPTDTHPGKNPARWEPFVLPPVEKATDTLARIIDMGREALGKLSEASAAVAKTVAEYREKIAKAETPEALTTLVAEHLKLEPMALVQAKHLIAERAKALGYVWNVPGKKFLKVPSSVEEQLAKDLAKQIAKAATAGEGSNEETRV